MKIIVILAVYISFLCGKCVCQDNSTDFNSTVLTGSESFTTPLQSTDTEGPALVSSTTKQPEDLTSTNKTEATTTEEPTTEPAITTESYITTAEPCESFCVNGVDRGGCQDDNGTTCNCTVGGDDFFSGALCEVMNLDVTNQTSTARTVNVTWPSPPNIEVSDYSFVYRYNGSAPIEKTLEEQDKPAQGEMLHDARVETSPFRMIDSTTARLIELNTTSWYVVCVLPNAAAEQLRADNRLADLDPERPECFYINTQDNLQFAYTLAAFIIAGLILVIIISLIVAKLIVDKEQNKKSSDIYYDGKTNKKKLLKNNGSDTSSSHVGDVRVEDLDFTPSTPRESQPEQTTNTSFKPLIVETNGQSVANAPPSNRNSDAPVYPPPQSDHGRKQASQAESGYKRMESSRQNYNQGYSRDSYAEQRADDASEFPQDDYSLSSYGATLRDPRGGYGPPTPSPGYNNNAAAYNRRDDPRFGYSGEDGPSSQGYRGDVATYREAGGPTYASRTAQQPSQPRHGEPPYGYSGGYQDYSRMDYIPEEAPGDYPRHNYEKPGQQMTSNRHESNIDYPGNPIRDPYYSRDGYAQRSEPLADY